LNHQNEYINGDRALALFVTLTSVGIEIISATGSSINTG
jgi:hypothetical protein